VALYREICPGACKRVTLVAHSRYVDEGEAPSRFIADPEGSWRPDERQPYICRPGRDPKRGKPGSYTLHDAATCMRERREPVQRELIL